LTKETTNPTCRVLIGWFKSSYSNAGGSCVETMFTTDATLVRDSKDRRPESPVIEFTPTAWTSFLNTMTRKDF
jgi:hypothetical protein